MSLEKQKPGPAADRLAVRGDLLDFVAAPAWGATDTPAVRFDRDHWLLIEHGRIVGRQASEPDASWACEDHSGRLILPGFIDTHVHCPQIEVLGSYGTELLDWLPHLTDYLAGGGRKIDRWYATLKVVEVPFDDEADAFENINTREELGRFEEQR
jgi:predicted amidohydrolase YtcJ